MVKSQWNKDLIKRKVKPATICDVCDKTILQAEPNDFQIYGMEADGIKFFCCDACMELIDRMPTNKGIPDLDPLKLPEGLLRRGLLKVREGRAEDGDK